MAGADPRSRRASGHRADPGVTRLAPSPTGALHLGNARTFLVNWMMARQRGWRIVMRMEDLDGPRVKPGAAAQALGLLEWLGLDYDDGPIHQSADLEPYVQAMQRLARAGRVFPSNLSRAEIVAASSAPHAGDGESRFPPELRPASVPESFDDPGSGWRFLTPPGPVRFDDRFAGAQSFDPSQEVGDFVVWTKRREPAYQLAVVVDDARQGVDRIVRGDDLLGSTARQLLLAGALGLEFSPRYWHLPLVVGEDGKRLAKRHGDTRLVRYRELGVERERVLGLLGAWCDVLDEPHPIGPVELLKRFSIDRMSRQRIVFTEEHDLWLRSRRIAG